MADTEIALAKIERSISDKGRHGTWSVAFAITAEQRTFAVTVTVPETVPDEQVLDKARVTLHAILQAAEKLARPWSAP